MERVKLGMPGVGEMTIRLAGLVGNACRLPRETLRAMLRLMRYPEPRTTCRIQPPAVAT